MQGNLGESKNNLNMSLPSGPWSWAKENQTYYNIIALQKTNHQISSCEKRGLSGRNKKIHKECIQLTSQLSFYKSTEIRICVTHPVRLYSDDNRKTQILHGNPHRLKQTPVAGGSGVGEMLLPGPDLTHWGRGSSALWPRPHWEPPG